MKVPGVGRRAVRRDARTWPIFGLTLASLIAPSVIAATPALPTGGQLQAGLAVIGSPSGASLTVSQSSNRAIIDWSSFSIGQGASVQFNNGAGATLNRVTGGTASAIDGLLSATGGVYLINPNGVIIGKTGVVNVGGTFAASTLDVADDNFMSGGSLTFTGPSTAAVINFGKIGALGGDVALIASRVDNVGEIDAANGDAGLIAGHQVVLRDKALDDGKFSVLVGGSNTSSTNGGLIQAAEVELRANGGNVYALAGNTQSVIKASGVSSRNGKVFLVAEAGSLSLGGVIQARGADGAGGQVETSASSVHIGSATISAGRGGTWLLDPNDLTIDQTAANTIETSLNGGTSVTQQTTASGTGGNGDIFVSANVAIDWATNASLTLSAYRNVNLGAGSTIASTGGGAVTLYADNTGTGTGTVSFASGAMVSTAGAVAILYNPASNPAGSAINPTSYTSPTNYSTNVIGGGVLTSSMLVSTLSDLQNVENNLTANYALGADINASATSGWNRSSGFAPIGTDAATPFEGKFDGQGHIITGLFIDRPTTFYVGLFGEIGPTSTVENFGLIGGSVTGYAYVGGLAGANGDPNFLGGGSISRTYSTAAVSGGSYGGVGGLVGYSGGTITQSYATGAVSGGTIGGLVGNNLGSIIQSYATGAVSGDTTGGLVGLDAGLVSQSHASGAVTGSSDVGGLVGDLEGGVVTSDYYGGYGANVGGLVGNAVSSTIAQSYATGSVAATADISGYTMAVTVGGLVGFDRESSITQSHATGAVTGPSDNGSILSAFGGLVGWLRDGSISQSWASGAVNAAPSSDYTGGLIGAVMDAYTGSTVTQSYATGAVTGGSEVGGLIGYGLATITQSYASGAVIGAGSDVGGLLGATTGYIRAEPGPPLVSQSYATGSVSGVSNVGGLVGLDATYGIGIAYVEYLQTYATGRVTGVSNVGGLIGNAAQGVLVASSYWDTQTSGQSVSAGGTGLTTAQFFQTSNLAGFTFGAAPSSSGWVIVDADGTLNNAGGAAGGTRPMLLSEYSTSIANGHQLQLMALNLAANYTLTSDIDLSGTQDSSEVWNTASGFVPVGGNHAAVFAGSFDGQGHTVSNLFISYLTPTAFTTQDGYTLQGVAGLFGLATSGTTLRNVNLANASVTVSDGMDAGALAGATGGVVSNASSSGQVSVGNGLLSQNGGADAGGLVGAVGDGGLIVDSYSSANV